MKIPPNGLTSQRSRETSSWCFHPFNVKKETGAHLTMRSQEVVTRGEYK